MRVFASALIAAQLFLVTTLVAHAQEAPTDVLFILDSSASVSRDDWRGRASDPNDLRLTAVRTFIRLATPSMRIGLVNLSDALSGNDGLDPPTALQTGLVINLTSASTRGKAVLYEAVASMQTTHQAGLEDGFTYMSRALSLTERVLGSSNASQKYAIVLTDGDVTGEDPRGWWTNAVRLKERGVNVVILRLGRREPPGLTNSELHQLNATLAPGGAARIVDRPEDLLGYYLQTFSDISATTFVNEVPGFSPGESGNFLNVLPWHDAEQIDLLLPAAPETVTAFRHVKTGRDVLADARAATVDDPNLEVLTLSRERLGSLEGEWALVTTRAIGPSYVVVRSGVTLQAYPILQPADATVAVIAARVRDGSVAIPDRSVIARPIDSGPGAPLLRGVLGPDLTSGVLAVGPGAEVRLEVRGPGSSVRPPILEKSLRVRSTEDIRVQDVAPAFDAVTPGAPLKPGSPAQVRLSVARGGCDVVSAAVSFSAFYPTPSPGVPEAERGAPAVGMGRAGAGLLFGFVPQGPGTIAPAVDHGVLQCSGQAHPIALLPSDQRAGGGFPVEVERLLKISQAGPAALTGLAAGTREMRTELQFEISSWRDEQVQLGIEGMPGATLAGGDITIRPREGSPRPRPRGGAVPVQVRLDRALPGGVSGSFTIIARHTRGDAAAQELGRFSVTYQVEPSAIAAVISRDTRVASDGITTTIAVNPSRLVAIEPATAQDFAITVGGLGDVQADPRVIRVAPGRELVEYRVFIPTQRVCAQDVPPTFTLGLEPIPSPNGAVLVAGVPMTAPIRVPPMEVRVSAPDNLGPLRPGGTLTVAIQSTSLCEERMTMRLNEPAAPDRFSDAGISPSAFTVFPASGDVQNLRLTPRVAAPRGTSGSLVLAIERIAGHRDTSYPRTVTIGYRTPLWSEEFPRTALAAFIGIAAALAGIFALPRILADPIPAHRHGDSSAVAARRRVRWFTYSLIFATGLAYLTVYQALARWLP